MTKTLLLFPHQLFDPRFFPSDVDRIHLIEEPLFFGDNVYHFCFHKQKIIFHHATIQHYLEHLKSTCPHIPVTHHSYQRDQTTDLLLQKINGDEIVVFDVVDYELEKRITIGCKNKNLTVMDSPMFLNTRQVNNDYFANKKSYRMHHFYEFQRKRLDILIETDGSPTGGQWSFDSDNRRKIPNKERHTIPTDPPINSDRHVQSAQEWVRDNFAQNPGNSEGFVWAVNHQQAKKALDDFITQRYEKFGDHEDAIDNEHWRLWHSTLSPYLNCGLLTPQQVLDAANDSFKQGHIPLNAHEGFVRQIIGWREYMRAIYAREGVSLRNRNDWGQQNMLSPHWYDGTTGLEPVDRAIRSNLQTAYNHHIERLMVIGNAMFVCNIHPNEAYKWFMEMYIDAYDWVMVGNIYGMSQDSYDGLITTKPYFSGSNYIFKMSNYKKSESTSWSMIWDALYWSFIIENKERLQSNIRWAMMVRRIDTMNRETIKSYLQTKRQFLQLLNAAAPQATNKIN